MQVITNISQWLNSDLNGGTVRPVFVPTMGALHEGHLALIDLANSFNHPVVVSIFVNPTQFGPKEDYGDYPRILETDIELCAKSGAAAVFAPTVDDIYPQGLTNYTAVEPPPNLVSNLCGATRIGHFRGVLTVVAKLFNIIRPSRAVFGQKDYQQLVLISQMVNDLCYSIEIVSCPTVRASDGLALSSRNRRLSSAGRRQATEIFITLNRVAEDIRRGIPQNRAVEDGLKSGLDFEYLTVLSARDLQPAEQGELRVFAAARVEGVRLIDNLPV